MLQMITKLLKGHIKNKLEYKVESMMLHKEEEGDTNNKNCGGGVGSIKEYDLPQVPSEEYRP